jgi:Tfp pilus assembly protein FimT
MLIKTVLKRSRAALAIVQTKCAAKTRAGPREPAGGLDIAQLEDRVLFSVSPGTEALLAGAVDGADDALDDAIGLLPDETTDDWALATEAGEASFAPHEQDSADLRRELVFVDVQSPDYQQLVDDLLARAPDGRDIQVVLLDAGRDGVQQISDALADYQDLDAVHFVSHGMDGAFKLGNTWLRTGNLDRYASAIAGWRDALSGQADLLLYGCDVASTADGSALIETLSALTGADVAASTDPTGSALEGGDWVLEVHTGEIETLVAFSAEVQASWEGVLATATYYLDGIGDGSDVPNAALKTTAPADPPLDNFDPGRDAFDGLLLAKSSSGVNETDSTKYQLWHTAPLTSTINESVTLTLWTAMKNFDTSNGGSVTAFLVESNSSGNGLSEIASATITRGDWDTANSGTWIEDTFDFGNVNYTLGVSKHLGVKIVVNDTSGDDMWFAYDATTYPARLDIGTPTNNAPVLDNSGDMALIDINEDDTAPAGDTVANIIASAGGDRITDLDAGALEGIAVIGVDKTNGQWQYSTTGGSTWLTFGAVSDTAAVLLDSTALIRFVPNAEYNGSAGNLSFRAWDQTVGADGDTGVDVSTNGGTTAYSSATETATLTVNPVNDAPVLDSTGAMTLTDVTEDDTNPAGDTVAWIVASAGGDRITDPDSGALEGLAVIGVDDTNGQWQYSTTGGATWLTFGAVSDTSAVLLDTNALIRFVPAANYNGPAGNLTFRAWDQTSGANGNSGVDVSINGGTTAFSTATETATLTVNPVNDPPTITNLASDMLAYTAGDGAVVIEQGANALVSDVDSANFNTGNLTVSIMSGGDVAQDVLSVRHQGMGPGQIGLSGGNVFYSGTLIGTATGGSGGADLVITLNANATTAAVTALAKNVTYENTDTVSPTTTPRTVRFTLEDGDGGTSAGYNAMVFIANPLNTPPAAITPTSFAVDENTNTTGGVSVGTLTTTDPDTGDTFIYTIQGGADAANFTIGGVGSDELILDDGVLDFETKTSYTVVVRVTDSAGGWHEESMTVAVNDLNESVGPISDTDASVNSVAENAGVGSAVAITAFASDPDGSDTVTYSLDVDAGGRFAIDTNSGLITVAGAFDFESASSHNVTVRATSSDGSNTTRVFAINVTDVNEAPTAITPTSFAVGENTDTTGGYSLGRLSTIDPDSPESFTYSIVGGADAAKFSFGGAGLDELVMDDGMLDFEAQTSYAVLVRVTDSGGLWFQVPLTINVADANDTAPVIPSGQSFSVSEDAANGTLLGAVVATDADTIGSLQNWSIDGGNDAGIFQIDPGTGQISVADNANLNYSSTTTYTLSIKVSDGVNWSALQDVTVAVNDVNYSPVAVDDNYSVNADGQLLVPASGVLANDTDRDGDPVTADLVGGPAHGSLDLRADGSFAYAPVAGFFGQDQFTYKAKDAGASSQVATATITVNPPLPPPPPPPPPPPIVVVNDSPPNDPPPADEETIPQSSDGSSTDPVGLGAVPPRTDAMRPLGRGALENVVPLELAIPAGAAAGQAAEDFDPTGADNNAASYYALMFRAWRSSLPESRWNSASEGTSMMEMSLAPQFDIAYFSELESVAEMMTSEIELDGLSAGALGMMSLSLSAGYAFFTIRAGYLVSSLLATMPAWRMIDPLPVLTYLDENRRKRGDGQQDETLESLVRSERKRSGSEDPDVDASVNRAKRGRRLGGWG